MSDRAKRVRPKQEVIDFTSWIRNHANKHGFAVLACVWDREKDSPGILIIDGADPHETDTLGGFSARFATMLLSQDDICEAVMRAAVLRLMGSVRVEEEILPEETEH